MTNTHKPAASGIIRHVLQQLEALKVGWDLGGLGEEAFFFVFVGGETSVAIHGIRVLFLSCFAGRSWPDCCRAMTALFLFFPVEVVLA